jgi:thiol-disulfide isomerase/thioredoxin
MLMSRRGVVAGGLAAGTLAFGAAARKPLAAGGLPNLASVLELTDPPVAPPTIVFTDKNGTPHQLAEFLGHGMVVNLWATWCVPCVAELPALASLARTLAPDDIAVMPLSSDRGGLAKVQAFFDERGISGLPILLDPKGAAGQAWGARGIPTTLIIDRQGRERARAEGAADWASPGAAEVIRKLVG